MQAPVLNPGRKGQGRKRRGILPVIDMTPMVDLGFLLISFFVITTELTKPTALDLAVPKDGAPTPVGESVSLTFLVDGNSQVYYYEGDAGRAIGENRVFRTHYASTGLRAVITQKQKSLDADLKNRDDLTVIIRPAISASYRNVVDILDEMTITQVKRFTLAKPGDADIDWLRKNTEK